MASLPIEATLGYDPWAWLVWGREVTRLDLSTVGGPSWKPLPVVLMTPFAWTGDLAPWLWMALARTAGLLAVAGVARVATRLARSATAGVAAVAVMLLSPDPEARYLRLVAEGHSAPVTAALAVWAVDRHLAGRPAQALVLATGLALDRPEAWPVLALYGLWVWFAVPRWRWLVALMAAVVPLLWFGGDWWGSGDPWHGADTAQVDAHDSDRVGTALTRAAEIFVLPAWAAVVVAVTRAARARDRTVLVLAAAATVWMATVVAMAIVLGYAAIGRFFLPASTLLCVLAGLGVAATVRWISGLSGTAVRVGVGVLLVVSAFGLSWPRVSEGWSTWPEVRHRHWLQVEMEGVLEHEAVGKAIERCGALAIDNGGIPRMSLSWAVDRHLDEITAPVTVGSLRGRATAVVARSGRAADRAIASAGGELGAVEVARSEGWVVYAVGCPVR